MSDTIDDPYPFESDDDLEIGELDLEDVDAFDAFADERVTVGELVGSTESWRFGHVIVDEAQDLTPMQWRMVMRRVAGRSLTIVGDLAQRSTGTGHRRMGAGGDEPARRETWSDRLPRELAEIERLDLTINYRSPAEIHALAVQVLADFAPDISPSMPLRSSGFAPEFRRVDGPGLDEAVQVAVVEMGSAVNGQIAVIGLDAGQWHAGRQQRDREARAPELDHDRRVRYLAASECKGLEFDGVVLVEPTAIFEAGTGPALLYIALTRSTQRLTIVHSRSLPDALRPTEPPQI